MAVYCFVEGCKSTRYKSVRKANNNNVVLTFFGFPMNPVLREKWIEALIASGHSQEYVAKVSKYSRICSLHFCKDNIEIIGFSPGRLKQNSVPTIFPNAPKKESRAENAEPDVPFIKVQTVAQCEDEIYLNPRKKRIYYAGDIKSENFENISPRMFMKMLNILTKSCKKKDKIINQLRVQHYRQKKKIESLEALLSELCGKNSSDTVQV